LSSLHLSRQRRRAAVTRPLGAWLLFTVNLVFWHLPALYDLTLRNSTVHALEHVTFLVFGVLFWLQVIPSPPFGDLPFAIAIALLIHRWLAVQEARASVM